MRSGNFDKFYALAILTSVIFLMLLGIRGFIENIYKKFIASEIKVTNANMTVKNKYYIKGMSCNS